MPLRDQDTGNKPCILVLGHHFQDTGNKSYTQCWGTSSRQRHAKQIIYLNAGTSLRDQDTGNKSHILMLGHRFETKTLATDQDTGNISRHLRAGVPLRDQDTGNKSYILVLGLRDQDTSNKSYIFVLGTTARPRHRQQIIHLSAGAPLRRHQQQNVHPSAGALRDQEDTINKSYIFVLGNHSETKTPATNRTFYCWGTTSRPRHRQQIVHLSSGAPLRDQDTGNKSYMVVLGHHFETKTPGTTSRPRHRQQTAHLGAGGTTSKTPASNRTFQCWGTTSRQRNRKKNHTS